MSTPDFLRRFQRLCVRRAACRHGANGRWPQKPIKVIVPFAAVGNTDSIARLTAERLSLSLGQSGIVENKAGGKGSIAADFVARAAPDGYTLMMAAMPVLAILPAITKTNFDAQRDFVPSASSASSAATHL